LGHEFILTYDGKPSYTVSIMEFRDDKVRGKHSTLRIHSWLPQGALNGSNGWTDNLEAREFGGYRKSAVLINQVSKDPPIGILKTELGTIRRS
jgi:hypothetical protein